MSLNSPFFLFILLPVSTVIYTLSDIRYRNIVLFITSLIFVFLAQPFSVIFYIILTLSNWLVARQISSLLALKNKTNAWVLTGVLINTGLLFLFKIWSAHSIRVITLIPWLPNWIQSLVVPIGFSFAAFQMISFLVDTSTGKCQSQPRLFDFLLYTFMYPKFIAGPIVFYRTIQNQFTNRKHIIDDVIDGMRRFIFGLAKKVLIADYLANQINNIFNLPHPKIPSWMAWLVIVCYTLQIYYDFSGYSDMAIGLGKMFGFNFPENFNYPYISKSISEFWRRWHITLSTWFREYIFFPLERRKVFYLNQKVNILIVFLLTGLWHGLTFNFIIWGMIHGLVITVENTSLGRWIRTLWAPVQHAYTLLILLIGWVFFRSPTLLYALAFIERLFVYTGNPQPLSFATTYPLPFIDNSVWFVLIIGIIFAFPVKIQLKKMMGHSVGSPTLVWLTRIVQDVIMIGLLILSVAAIATYNFTPDIYSKF